MTVSCCGLVPQRYRIITTGTAHAGPSSALLTANDTFGFSAPNIVVRNLLGPSRWVENG